MKTQSFLRSIVQRSMPRRRVVGIVATALSAAMLLPSMNASADTSTKPRARGMAAGPMVFTPRLRLGAGYNNNIGLNAKDEVSRASAEFIVAPSLGLKLRDTGVLKFSANGGVAWRKYLDERVAGKKISGLDANGQVDLQVNYGGPVSFVLSDNVRQSHDAIYGPDLSDDPYEVSFSEYGADIGANRVLTNTARAGLKFHPGGDNDDAMGFVGGLDAIHTYTHYQQDDAQYDRQRIHGRLSLGWRFLPRSVLSVQGGVGRNFYKHDAGVGVAHGSYSEGSAAYQERQATRNNDSTSYNAAIGLRTLILPRLSVNTRVGYSGAVYDDGPNPGGLSLLFQGDSQLTEGMKLRFGYATNFTDATFGNYLVYHRLFANYSLKHRIFNVSLSAFAQINKYASVNATLVDGSGSPIEDYYDTSKDLGSPGDGSGTFRRRDYPIGASAEFSVNAGDHVLIGANYSIMTNQSNLDAIPRAGWAGGNKVSGNPDFLRHRIYLFVALAL